MRLTDGQNNAGTGLKKVTQSHKKAIEKCFRSAVCFVDRRSKNREGVGAMEGITTSLAKPTQMRRDGKPRPRSEAKRALIVEAAIRHFAERGYSAARVEDIAAQLGIAKGSVFQHFKSKDGLFFEAYKRAVQSFPRYMQAPAAAQERGFFDVLRYWLGRTENMVRDNWSSYRIYLVGNYGTDLALRREINRFLVAEDPYGWRDFVSFGVKRGELRPDLDVDLIGSILEWTMDRFQDALLTEELDPGLFRKSGPVPEEKEARIDQFVELLRRAIGSEKAQARGKKA
jgi:TetR/AcrR family transcriptional regulator